MTTFVADLSAGKIKELSKRYSCKDSYSKLKDVASRMMKNKVVTDEELSKIANLFPKTKPTKKGKFLLTIRMK